jgi:hypothetical protein
MKHHAASQAKENWVIFFNGDGIDYWVDRILSGE